MHVRMWRAVKELGNMPKLPLVIFIAFIFTAIFGPLFAPFTPVEGNLRDQLVPPLSTDNQGRLHILGTDTFGRDILSRIIYGARISVIVAIAAIFFSGSMGTIVGLFAGFLGGWIDGVLSRVVDITLSMPAILLAVSILCR